MNCYDMDFPFEKIQGELTLMQQVLLKLDNAG